MSSMKLTPFAPKPREITPAPGDTSYAHYWEYFLDFLKYRSFRRIYIFTGGAGVLLTAWYLYNRLNENQDEQLESTPAANLPSTNLVRSHVNLSSSNGNNTEIPKGDPLESKVVIHCCPRGFFVPSIATEPLKLETFLRVANVPYEVIFCNEYEAPLMTYGEKVANDFRECIRILSDVFDVNLESKDASASRKTASHLVDISLENHFAWAILIWRWIYDEGKSMNKIHAMNALGEEVVPEVAQRVKEAIRFHPIGQMDKVEFQKSISQGIHDLSAALGKHKYFQGQEPGAVDCHAFAILSQIMWNMPGSPFANLLKKYGNLMDFWRRIKEKYWPDWNELILKPDEFQEIYNATIRHHHRALPTQSKRNSISRENCQGSHDNDSQGTGASNDIETGGTKSRTPGATELAYTVSPVGNQLPDPDAVTVITKKEEVSAENTFPPSQPVGILKAGPATTSTNGNVIKPRSGLVTASIGSTKIPVEEINKVSLATLAKEEFNTGRSMQQQYQNLQQNILCPPPMQLPQQQVQQAMQVICEPVAKSPNMICLPPAQPAKQPNSHSPPPHGTHLPQIAHPTTQAPQHQTVPKRESMTHVHKSSVKFANVASTESTVVHPHHQGHQTQHPTKTSNGNFHPNFVPQSPLKSKSQYPGSVGELSKKRSPERESPEQVRHSVMQRYPNPNSPYPNYPHALQRQTNEPTVMEDFHRMQHNSLPPPPPQYYHTLPAYGQPAYSVAPVLFSNQPLPGAMPPTYPQAMHYLPPPPSTNLTSSDEGLDHNPLNPEQMQKAAQAHLDAYFQRQKQVQRQPESHQYPSHYHTPAGILPGFVAPPFDPRNPAATLLRF